jgi:hypothetical protein
VEEAAQNNLINMAYNKGPEQPKIDISKEMPKKNCGC